LAAAGTSHRHHVASLQDCGNGFALDRRRKLVALSVDALQHRLPEVHRLKAARLHGVAVEVTNTDQEENKSLEPRLRESTCVTIDTIDDTSLTSNGTLR